MFDYLDRRLHIIYLVTALALGAGMALLTPPGAVPDESSHVDKIAAVSAGALVGLPEGERIPAINEGYGDVRHKIAAREPMALGEEIRAAFARPLECTRDTSHIMRNIIGYSPLPYLFPVLAYKGLCAVESSFGAFLYSSRLLNLVAAVLLVTAGIRFAGHGRWSLAVIGLLPMTLFLLPSISADSLMIASALCYIGIISGAVSRDGMPAGRELLLLVFAAFLLALTKPGAAWLLALVLVCYPVYRGAGRSFAPLLLMAGILPVMVHALFLAGVSGYSAINYPAGADPAVNLKIIVETPFAFIGILFDTYFRETGFWIFRSLVGNLGWLDVPPTTLVFVAVVAAMCLSMLLNTRPAAGGRVGWHIAIRLYVVALAAGSAVLLAVPLYITWTAAGAPVVDGLQGRYFIPTAALLLMCAGLCVSRRRRNILAPLALALVVLGVLGSMHSLYVRYYGAVLDEDAGLTGERVPLQAHLADTPVWLSQGDTASGEFTWRHAARIVEIGVLIGNGHNRSDGRLTLQLCNDSGCTEAQRKLRQSVDNAYLQFRFKRPLVAMPGSVLRYSFHLGGGSHPVAFWTQPAQSGAPGLRLGESQPALESTPSFIVKFAPEAQ